MTQPIRIRTIDRHAASAVLGIALLSGCTTIDVGEGEKIDLTAVGIVRVRVPVANESTLAVERSGVGLGFDGLPGGGAYLGWSSAKWVIADPAKCQLLVIVRTEAQVRHAQDILSKLKGESPCIVDHSGQLQR